MEQSQKLILKNVSVHNLKKVSLTLNKGELIVFTGVSGSGKSSLAFDTIYVEGQRRYIESLSHQARRHLSELPKPNAEKIEGISPTIAIEQKLSVKTPRSTVGTLTGIYDFLRVLFAKIAVPYCPISGEKVTAQSKEKIIAEIQSLPPKIPIIILAPYGQAKKGECKEEIKELLKRGFTRLKVNEEWVDLTETESLDKQSTHDLSVVIDRLNTGAENNFRIAEAVTLALELGQGIVSIYDTREKKETLFSQTAYSAKSNTSYPPLQPHDFSFNHPLGMCPDCQGIGTANEFDLQKIIDPEKSIEEDCCSIGSSYQTIKYGNIYDNLARIYKFKINTPWKKIPEEGKEAFLYGINAKWTKMIFVHPETKQRWTEFIKWKGVIHEAKERLAASTSDSYRKKLSLYMVQGLCSSCKGSRIKPYPAAAKLGGKTIGEITSFTLQEVLAFFENLKLSSIDQMIGNELIKEIKERLSYLLTLGLSYLSLNRTAPTLSGGESQRVRLASQLGASLVGAIYILDEPSIGLHPTDHHKLIQTLIDLKAQGNTVIVVEHDAETIFAADTVVDVGPLAGKLGGEIIYTGDLEGLLQSPKSLTGGYLSGKLQITPGKKRTSFSSHLKIVKATHHNLKSLTVSIPLGGFICVTGVSGSGKSSLIYDILYPALSNQLHGSFLPVGAHKEILGTDAIDKVIAIDQSPIGRTPRSNPATYIKLFDDIRDLFTKLPESELRGMEPGHFSFNVKEGSCPYCLGLGSVRIDMDFMEDAWVECPECLGKRFEPDVLSIRYKGKNIADILKMDVKEALLFFEAIPQIHKKLLFLSEVGLDYLSLGQSSTTLSGGEAQRIKLAKELIRPSSGKTLYILDEPTTGLHFKDVDLLLKIFQRLVDHGNTVLVIEHNLDLIQRADWLIDLGPKAGSEGGSLVGEGSPAKIAKLKTLTAEALRQKLTPKKAAFSSLVPSSSRLNVINAEQNNLKSVSLSIPHDQITIFTGPSGSGKSSLAFETIYAEGQRRYTETLSPYFRSLVKTLPKPKIERIEGLLPAIALEQKVGGLNPRSTIGTITEIYDLLRVLYAHRGEAHCPETKEKLQFITKEFIVRKLFTLPSQEKIQVLAPITLKKKQSFEEFIQEINQLGFIRIRLNGVIYPIDEPISFEKYKKNTIELVIDRLTIDPKNEKRLYEALDKALEITQHIVIIARENEDLYFNLRFAAPTTGKSYPFITPQTFSFNHEDGMCLECQGLGSVYGFPLQENKELMAYSLLDLISLLAKEKGSKDSFKEIIRYFKKCGIDTDLPLENLKDFQLHFILHGGSEVLGTSFSLRWIGLNHLFARLIRLGSPAQKEKLLPWMTTSTCPACEGTRLNPLARHVTIETISLPQICGFNLEKTLHFIQAIPIQDVPFLQETLSQIIKQLSFILSLGLGYLSLDRAAPTLSGGELQRLRLAKQLGSGLTSCLYVLDEPTIGLHPHNNHQLNQALLNLKNQGNTLILVEHDPMTLQIADRIVDFGPEAGAKGGKVIALGTLSEIMQNPASLTGAYLSKRKTIPIPPKRRPFHPDIRIQNASLHNLKNISVDIPYRAITCITGVSGSGKSTLIRHLLKKAAEISTRSHFYDRKNPIELFGSQIFGLEIFEKVITVDQSPIGQTARADVTSFSEVAPLIRSLLASLPQAMAKGLKPGHFSPNHIRGMCKTCWGLGYKTINLQYLPSIRVTCESCHGHKLNPISLQITYKNKHFGDFLHFTVQEAALFFSEIPKIVRKLETLESVGLSYLKLGQEIATLSGGEAQRLRLSRELAKREMGKTLYLIDEPTVGLHTEDIAKLLPIFHRLADKKNTLIIIEHNLDLIANADYIIDLGPDAGDHGGKVIATGTPEEVAKAKESYTGKYLKTHLR